MKNLGTPTTLGEFRKLTEQYPDETLLQFRNEPVHEFIEIDGDLCFNETNRWDNIGIIGHGFDGYMGEIDEVRRIIIGRKNILSYPILPLTMDEAGEDDEIYKASVHQAQFALHISPETIEQFKKMSTQTKIAAESIESLAKGMKAYDNANKQKNKPKGHERPYKFHK